MQMQTLRHLGNLPMPVRLLLGNHDDRANFRDVFAEASVDDFGFIQSMLDVPARRFLSSIPNGPVAMRAHIAADLSLHASPAVAGSFPTCGRNHAG